MSRRIALCLATVGLAGLVVAGAPPAHASDSRPVFAGSFSGQTKVTKSWVPGGWGLASGARHYSFGKGCATGACAVRVTDGSTQNAAPRGRSFGWSGSDPVGCYDNDTGAIRTKHGFDYTYTVSFAPSATTTRAGVTYVSAIKGTVVGTLAVNAVGRGFNCLVNPMKTPTATERSEFTLTLDPLAAPTKAVTSPPLALTPAATAATGTVPAFHLPLSERQRTAAALVAAGRLSSVPGALVTPTEALRNVGARLPQDLLLVALLGLLLVFPAQIFNSTYEENHERIDRQLARLRLRRRATAAVPTQPGPPDEQPPSTGPVLPSRGRRLTVFGGCAVAGTLLGGLLDPNFGANMASYALAVGVFLALVLAVLVTAFTGRLFRSVTHHGHDWYLHAIPSALLIAVLCVVVSRVTHFEPGYLYGVLGGAVFAAALDRRSEGRTEVAVALAALAVALVAWVFFEPVARAADGSNPAFWLLSADSFLSALFIGGVEGLLFGLIPLRFLPGYRIKGWSWVAWGVLTAVVLYVFVHVLLAPEAGYLGRSTAASVTLTLVLFGAFAVVSGLFWLYFRWRPSGQEPAPATVLTTGDTEATGAPREPSSAPSLVPASVVPRPRTEVPQTEVPRQGRPTGLDES